ncbi:MAG: LPS assembly protein LptD [Proteobacteria bacterium]|nr:LPS assembly protein LptD [Pseudomonadota bacterium]MDA0995061.1 LPS assembly protein LptD [Pseudomonadota bacterium]
MPKLTHLLPGLSLLLAFSPAEAQQRLQCTLPESPEIASQSQLAEFGREYPDAIEFQAGEVETTFGDDPTVSMSGGVLLRRGDRLAGAESADYDPLTRALHLTGGVQYEDPNSTISSESAEFGYDTGRIRFEGAEFQLGDRNARGTASVLEINQDGQLQLAAVGYTTCPPESEDWIIEASSINLDTKTGVGTARGMRLRFKGVPILYSPYLSFPITDARKSGVLTPEMGSTGRSGNEVSIPYYWNIAPNYDATLTPRLLTARGLQMGTEFRYLTKGSSGSAQFEYLPDDSKFNDTRHMVDFVHQTLFSNGWRNQVDFNEVSDNQYFEDLGGSLSVSSITHLNRSLLFDYYGNNWSLFAMAQVYQTIDEAILPMDEPYRRLPQVRINGYWPDAFLGLDYRFNNELVYFDHDVGVTGWRLNVAPQIELPLESAGWFVKPAVTLDHTRYSLENTLPGVDPEPSRSLPIASLDLGLQFERVFKSSAGRIQTLEPRVLYVHVPYRDQADLPVFDTILPDLNLVQLYRKNRFLGVDRIADTDQLSIGVTSRVLETSSGRELMSATIGQARYMSPQRVSLPGQTMSVAETSDYIAEVRFLLYDNLNFDVGHQWNNNENGTTQSEARLQYRPATNKILNFSYRFRRDSLEQGDLSWSWPLSQKWNFVGRYNYSFRDEKALEQFYGLEFESCCWGLRLVSRRYIFTRDGTHDSSVGLQLILKGMASVGTAAGKLMERGILGYSRELN